MTTVTIYRNKLNKLIEQGYGDTELYITMNDNCSSEQYHISSFELKTIEEKYGNATFISGELTKAQPKITEPREIKVCFDKDIDEIPSYVYDCIQHFIKTEFNAEKYKIISDKESDPTAITYDLIINNLKIMQQCDVYVYFKSDYDKQSGITRELANFAKKHEHSITTLEISGTSHKYA